MTLMDKLSEAIARALIWVIFAIALLAWMEVFLRYVMRAPTVWAPELITAFSAVVFLYGGLLATTRNLHIRITIFHDRMPRAAQRVVAGLTLLAALIFVCGLGYGAWNQFVGSVWRFSGDRWIPERTGRAWNVPLPPVTRGLLVLACVLLTLQILVTYGRQMLGLPPRPPAESPAHQAVDSGADSAQEARK